MKVIVIAAVAIVIIAFGSNAILKQSGFSSQEQTSSPSVRLD